VPALNDFPNDFRGERFRSGDEGFAQARRIYNMRHDHDAPALIARAADVNDVVCLMRYASEKGAPVAIRSGGHSSDGTAMPNGALVLDMTAMTKLTVEKATNVCRVESGVLLGQLDAGTQEYGLVVPAGTVSTTGVAGLTLGGGVGYNMRRYGATVDNLLGCDVVTVDGRKVRATREENPDLLWALSGGGGNFGVVTAFEFRGSPLGPQVFSGVIVFPPEQAADVLISMDRFMPTAPRELSVIAAGTACPPFPPVPADVHGTPVQMRNLLNAPAPTAPLPSTVQNLWYMGGAISEDFDEDSVAFSRAGAVWFWESVGQWDGAEHDEEYLAWSNRSYSDLQQNMRANGYVNLTCDLGPEWLKGLYGSDRKYRRLIEAKKKWDPHNLLRFNKNFKPGAS
jgi:FAD/FMN-containing dehydrogenase